MHDAASRSLPRHPPATDELFDEPVRWRAQAARALGLRDEELMAAVSPGAACPMVLRSLAASIASTTPLEVLVDVGSGGGGISEWLRCHTGAAVIAIEPVDGSRQAAETLFPALSVRQGTAEATGLPGATADAAVLCGVSSLIDDLAPVLVEMRRIVRPGATLSIADLFSAEGDPLVSGPNVFRCVEQIAAALTARGWTVESVGCGTPSPDPVWTAAAGRVDEWIRTHRREHPAFAGWAADREHLDRHIGAGDLLAGCVVARRSGPGRSVAAG